MAKVRILAVSTIQLDLLKSNPPQLSVSVAGCTATPGWRSLALVPLEKKLSADGILDLEAVGQPPSGVVQQVVTPVSINHIITSDVAEIVGVKVHARSNSLVQLRADDDSSSDHSGGFTTFAIGEEGPAFTTLALGEETPIPTTMALGEEGWDPKPFFGETDPRAEGNKPPFGEDVAFQMGFRGPFGRR